MKLWTRTACTLALVAALSAPLTVPTVAMAADSTDSSAQAYSEIKQWYVDRGVAGPVASSLAQGIIDGKMPLSASTKARCEHPAFPSVHALAEEGHDGGQSDRSASSEIHGYSCSSKWWAPLAPDEFDAQEVFLTTSGTRSL